MCTLHLKLPNGGQIICCLTGWTLRPRLETIVRFKLCTMTRLNLSSPDDESSLSTCNLLRSYLTAGSRFIKIYPLKRNRNSNTQTGHRLEISFN